MLLFLEMPFNILSTFVPTFTGRDLIVLIKKPPNLNATKSTAKAMTYTITFSKKLGVLTFCGGDMFLVGGVVFLAVLDVEE